MRLTTSLTLFLILCSVMSLQSAIATNEYSNTSPNNISRKYITPQRIIPLNNQLQSGVSGADFLLEDYFGQLTTDGSRSCILSSKVGKKASVLIDFGKEIHGSIELAASIRESNKPIRIRVRYGESVSEAMSDTGGITPMSSATNDHAMRDFIVALPWLGTVETSNSGFRFVRIDLVDEDVDLPLKAVRAILKYRDIPYLGSFECNNQRLNDIWQTGAYTVHLNMQEYLWDGIKRDRLVWLGDVHPEVMTINSVFGANDVVNKSMDFGRQTTPLPKWMNDMCSYSLWWVITQRDLYLYQGDMKYLETQRDYLKALLKQVISQTNGNREALTGGGRFLDWPTSENPEVVHAGLQAMMVMSLDAGAELCRWLGEAEIEQQCIQTSSLLKTYTPDHKNNKQAAALMALAGLDGASTLSDKVISKNGAYGFSTFFGYYMLCAMAKAGDYTEAMNIMSDYWGLMLDLGATTFWEDLDYDMAKNAARIDELCPADKFDIHAQGGDYCYKGFRHSFCHCWASGPTSWLSQYVLGVTPVEPGFKSVKIEPHLGDLEWAEGTFPTPHGLIYVKHTKDANGKITSKIDVPRKIKVVK